MKNSVLFIILIGVLAGHVSSFPNEVPHSDIVCKEMTPGHGLSGQKRPAPFNIQVSPKNLQSGQSANVVLKGKEDFKGFYLQARNGDDIHAIGKFTSPPKDTKVHDCLNGKENAIFHASKGKRNNLKFTWESPKDFKGDVNFVATFVESFNIFWVKVGSDSNITVT